MAFPADVFETPAPLLLVPEDEVDEEDACWLTAAAAATAAAIEAGDEVNGERGG